MKDGYHSVCELKLGQLSEGQEWDVGAGPNTHTGVMNPTTHALLRNTKDGCSVPWHGFKGKRFMNLVWFESDLEMKP